MSGRPLATDAAVGSKNYVAPNGLAIIGTLEKTTCRCEILGINDDGTPEYAGASEFFYEETHPILRNGKPLFLDEKGEAWTFDELVAQS